MDAGADIFFLERLLDGVTVSRYVFEFNQKSVEMACMTGIFICRRRGHR